MLNKAMSTSALPLLDRLDRRLAQLDLHESQTTPRYESVSVPHLAAEAGSAAHIQVQGSQPVPGSDQPLSASYLHKKPRGYDRTPRLLFTAFNAGGVASASPSASPESSTPSSGASSPTSSEDLEPPLYQPLERPLYEPLYKPLYKPLHPNPSQETVRAESVEDLTLTPTLTPTDSANMIRKKSGELVKSSLKLPSLARTRSLPTTPSKAVHFDKKLEHVRKFYHGEKPTAVSNQSSPVEDHEVSFHWGSEDEDSDYLSEDDESSESENDSRLSDDEVSDDENTRKIGYFNYMHGTEWALSTPGFSRLSLDQTTVATDLPLVMLESLALSADKSALVGHVLVRNLAYDKSVAVRYTLDHWRTVSEVKAEYDDDVRKRVRALGFDKFTFVVSLADMPLHTLVSRPMLFCVRYCTMGQEYWDNNGGRNYEALFRRTSRETTAPALRSLATMLPTSSTSRHHRRTRSTEERKHVASNSHDSDDSCQPLRRTSKSKLVNRYSFTRSGQDSCASETEDETFRFPKQGQSPSPPSIAAMSYQELLAKYCFFEAEPKKPELKGLRIQTNLGSMPSPAMSPDSPEPSLQAV